MSKASSSSSSHLHRGQTSAMAALIARSALLVLGLVLTSCTGWATAAKDGLAIQLASPILSLGSADKLEVAVTNRDGSPAPSVTVTLLSAERSGSNAFPVMASKKMEPAGDGKYVLDFLTDKVSVGKYKLKLQVKGDEGSPLTTVVVVTAPINVSNVQLAVLDSSAGLSDSVARLDFDTRETTTLSASHLQKLQLTFELKLPTGASFKPQQVFLIMRHETLVENLYLVKFTGKHFELTLDFLGLVEKLHYLSGIYTLDLIVGDDTMENSFVWTLATLDLALPEAPEGEAAAPTGPADAAYKFGPKPEIAHIFRQPEKRPPIYLSTTFFVLTLLPLLGFFIGLQRLGANCKLFPSSGLPLAAAVGFHGGIASILGLYFLFWLKLNLFTTLRTLGIFGLVTIVPGFYSLSYLANQSSKVKTL